MNNWLKYILLLILLPLAGHMSAQVPVIDTVCPGDYGYYKVSGEPGSTYSWILTWPNGDEELLPSDADTIHVLWNYPSDTYTLQVIQHSEFGCDAEAVFGEIIILVAPDVYAGADQTIPFGTNTIIADATASGADPLKYQWTPAGLLVDATVLNPVTVNLNATTTFTLTVKDMGGCESYDTVTIFVEGGPLAVNPVAEPGEICVGSLVQLYANAGGGSGNYTYSWTSLPPGFLSPEENPIASPGETTTYIVEVFDGYNTSTGSVTVVVNALPDVFAGADQAILSGTATVIADATATGPEPLYYSWEPAALLLDPTVLHPTTVNLLATTTFTLTVTDANGCSNSDEMTVLIISGNLAVEPYAAPEAICLGGWAQLHANASGGAGNYTYLWTSDPAGFVSTEADPVVAPTETTLYTVAVTDGFETVSGSVTLTVNPLPVVFAGADQTISSGGTAFIGDATASGSEPLEYSWTPAELLVNPTVLNPVTVNLTATTTFTLTVTDANGCVNNDQVVISVGDPLSVDPEADPDAICLGGMVQLYANASGGSGNYTYLWASDPIGFTSTEENPIVSPSETTTYHVEVNDGFSVATGSVIVTVHLLPEVYAGADQVIFYGAATLIGDASAFGAQPMVYNWTPAALLLDPTVLHPVTVTLYAPTTFTLTVTDANGCTASDEMVVTVEGGPLEINPLAVPTMICVGEIDQLSANASNGTGVYSYSWSSDPAGFTSTEASPIATPVVTTIYTVEVTDGISTLSGSVTVTVNPLPGVYAGADQVIPYNTSTSIPDATASGASPLVFEWSPAGLLVDATVLNPVTIGLDATTSFILMVTDANGCTNSDTMTVTITGGPLAVLPGAEPDTICLGETAQLAANPSGGTGTYTFSWSSAPAGFASTEENPVASPVVNTTYFVEVSDGLNVVNGAVTVTVFPLPSVFAGADQVIAYNTSTGIPDATVAGTGPFTYAWTPAGLLVDPTVPDPVTVDLTATTVFTLTVTDANGCQASDDLTIEIKTITMLQAITGPGGHCVGNAITIPLEVDNFSTVASFQLKLGYNAEYLECEGYTNENPLLPGLTGWIDHVEEQVIFQWSSLTPITFSQLTKVVDLVFTLRQAGLGTLDWYTGDSESYFADPSGTHIPAEFQSGEVMIYEPPVIFLDEAMPVCEGNPVTISGTALGTNPPLHYQWIYPTGYVSGVDPSFDSITMANAGVYTLLVTDAMGCSDEKAVTLQVFENPVALFHGIDTLVVEPGYILEAGSGMAYYLWNTGGTTDYIVIDTAGMYVVEMISMADCYGIDSVYIKLVPPQCMFIPNAFTPNGDGLNDTFKPASACPVIYYRMMIFNRWGEKLFETGDISEGWDGGKNGKPCPGDAYVYMISYKVLEANGATEENVAAGIVLLLK